MEPCWAYWPGHFHLYPVFSPLMIWYGLFLHSGKAPRDATTEPLCPARPGADPSAVVAGADLVLPPSLVAAPRWQQQQPAAGSALQSPQDHPPPAAGAEARARSEGPQVTSTAPAEAFSSSNKPAAPASSNKTAAAAPSGEAPAEMPPPNNNIHNNKSAAGVSEITAAPPAEPPGPALPILEYRPPSPVAPKYRRPKVDFWDRPGTFTFSGPSALASPNQAPAGSAAAAVQTSESRGTSVTGGTMPTTDAASTPFLRGQHDPSSRYRPAATTRFLSEEERQHAKALQDFDKLQRHVYGHLASLVQEAARLKGYVAEWCLYFHGSVSRFHVPVGLLLQYRERDAALKEEGYRPPGVRPVSCHQQLLSGSGVCGAVLMCDGTNGM